MSILSIGTSERLIAALLAVALGAPAAWAAASSTAELPAPKDQHLIGEYLAARHAQQVRDSPAAASWYEKAIAADPDSPELINRTFVMAISVGRFEKARPLAERQLTLEPSAAVAQLVLLTERLRAGDANGALKYATTMPNDGLHRFVAPLA